MVVDINMTPRIPNISCYCARRRLRVRRC